MPACASAAGFGGLTPKARNLMLAAPRISAGATFWSGRHTRDSGCAGSYGKLRRIINRLDRRRRLSCVAVGATTRLKPLRGAIPSIMRAVRGTFAHPRSRTPSRCKPKADTRKGPKHSPATTSEKRGPRNHSIPGVSLFQALEVVWGNCGNGPESVSMSEENAQRAMARP